MALGRGRGSQPARHGIQCYEPYRHNYTDGVSVTSPNNMSPREGGRGREGRKKGICGRQGWCMHLQGAIFHPTFVLLRAVKLQGSSSDTLNSSPPIVPRQHTRGIDVLGLDPPGSENSSCIWNSAALIAPSPLPLTPPSAIAYTPPFYRVCTYTPRHDERELSRIN